MKKGTLALTLALLLTFASACSNASTTTSPPEPSNQQSEVKTQPLKDGITVENVGFRPYLESSNNAIEVEMFCSYVNTSDSAFKISDIEFDLVDANGVTLATERTNTIEYAPEFLLPGERGFAFRKSAGLARGYAIKSLDEPAKLNVKISSNSTDDTDNDGVLNVIEPITLELGETDKQTTVTFTLENPSPKVAYYNTAIAGLYDANDTLLGCLYNLSPSSQITENGKIKFTVDSCLDENGTLYAGAVRTEAAGRVRYYEDEISGSTP